jgi:hypothetical protein
MTKAEAQEQLRQNGHTAWQGCLIRYVPAGRHTGRAARYDVCPEGTGYRREVTRRARTEAGAFRLARIVKFNSQF